VVDLWGIRPPKVLVQEGDPDFPEITSATDLDGIRWMPWGAILFAEEELEEPVVGDQDSGHLYEIILDPKDRMTAMDVKDRPQVGRLRHEGSRWDLRRRPVLGRLRSGHQPPHGSFRVGSARHG
jgi:hypothetical protein